MACNTDDKLMEPIAIVGMGMRFPGESHSSDSFWDLLSKGRDGWRTMPKHRCKFKFDAKLDLPLTTPLLSQPRWLLPSRWSARGLCKLFILAIVRM